jgi:hypothetical protein
VAVKVMTQTVSNKVNVKISKIYKQACDEVKLIRTAEERMLDISYLVHPFGVSIGVYVYIYIMCVLVCVYVHIMLDISYLVHPFGVSIGVYIYIKCVY